MANISLRLPDDLARKLEREIRLERRGRSEIVRDALEVYLATKARERRMAEMVQEARALYGEPENLDEARRIEQEFLPAENEALQRTEGGSEAGSDERWWK